MVNAVQKIAAAEYFGIVEALLFSTIAVGESR
jgi:hypothetical protein